ncbi:MAG: YeeE/YedE thiosulfate transporter family protein [Geminicoccaceae bacterium]
MSPRPFWPPLVAGILLGLVLLLTFLITGHGLGASGFFTRLTAALGGWLMPVATAANSYLGPFLQGNPLSSWICWEIVGVAIGALAGSITSGRFHLALERGPSTGSNARLAYALLGGVLVGFGARLARGCTSGLGLSGGATLAVAAFVFLIAFFAAGFLVTFAARRVWQ